MPKSVIFEPQIIAGNKIMQYFRGHNYWVLLAAQMQSGKSVTYLYVACDALRTGMISNVIIFSGNSEIELKVQLQNDLKNFIKKKYRRYLKNAEGIRKKEYKNIRKFLTDKIRIIWGAELNKFDEQVNNTLFIWDESHSAQNKGMRPAKFLKLQNIDASGNSDNLYNKHNYFLSVSATPFSEVSDAVHEHQFKAIVRLEVNDGYFGVGEMLLNENIHGFDNWREKLEEALNNHVNNSKKYVIIRGKNDDICEEIQEIALEAGWEVKIYNSEQKDIENLNTLRHCPLENTVVIIKGMGRMGKVVPKKHILFVMETAKNSNSDTILQSLLGRMCGWHKYRDIIVYLHNNILKRGDLERYIRFSNNETIIPRKSTNLKTKTQTKNATLNPIIPIRISLSDRNIDDSLDLTNVMINKHATFESIIAASRNKRWTNNNNPEQTDEILEKLRTFNEKQFELRNAQCKTYSEVPKKIHNMWQNCIPDSLGSSCGIALDGSEIKLYWFKKSIPEYGIKAGDIYLDTKTKAQNDEYRKTKELEENVPKSTKKEVFTEFVQQEESGSLVLSNGSYTIPLPLETSDDVYTMQNALEEIIKISIHNHTEHISMPRKIVSNPIDKSTWKGILVSNEVLTALSVGGSIYCRMATQFSVKLKVLKSRGKQRAEHLNAGLIRIAEIRW